MSEFLDENEKITSEEETDSGLLLLFPDENNDDDLFSEDDGEAFSLSFGKVNAARKEEEFNYLPFLNIPEVIDDDDDDDLDDNGESFSLSFGKVSAAKKEQDYVYLPFLNVDENALDDEEEKKDDDDDDSGIDIVGGDNLFDLTPLKTKEPSQKNTRSKENEKPSKYNGGSKKQASSKKSKAPNQQKKKMPPKNAVPQKPNKVQQIMAQMDPDILASVSADPRQMLMLEETIRSELIKQAAHNAVAKELGADTPEVPEPKKRPPQSGRQRPSDANNRNASGALNFSRQGNVQQKNKPISIVDTSTISEFGSEPSAQPVVQQIPNAVPAPQNQVQQIKNIPVPAPQVIAQPVIVQQPVQTPPPVQQGSSSASSPQNTQRKPYVPTSPAAIRAAMKSGTISFDSPSSSNDSSPESSTNSTQNRKRIEIQKQIGEKRSGCVIGAIALLMVVFIAIIALISGGDIMTQCGYNERFSQAQELVNRGDYNGAIEILEDIKGYSQTASLLNECYYALGLSAQNAGDYESAISYYNKTIDYSEAIGSRIDLQIIQADEYSDSAKKSNNSELYMRAYNLYGLILTDIAAYPDLKNDSETAEIQNKSNSARYEYAKLLYNEEKYTDAKVHFESLNNASYADSETWYYNSCFRLGRMYYNNGNYLSAEEELNVFIKSDNASEAENYSDAIAYLALSRMYGTENLQNKENDYLSDLLSLLVKANEGNIQGVLQTDLRNAIASPAFVSVKLGGFWQNDNQNSISFENGNFSATIANSVTNSVSEISTEELRFDNGNLFVTVNGSEYAVMNNITFESTYQVSPQTITFVNPYDGLTYTMYRNR